MHQDGTKIGMTNWHRKVLERSSLSTYIYVYIDHILVTQEENVAREKGSNVVYMTSPPL